MFFKPTLEIIAKRQVAAQTTLKRHLAETRRTKKDRDSRLSEHSHIPASPVRMLRTRDRERGRKRGSWKSDLRERWKKRREEGKRESEAGWKEVAFREL